MRAKRKALHYKEATKTRPAKLILLATTPQVLREEVEQEDFARLENEGGIVNSKISGRVDKAVSEIIHQVF